MFVKSMMVLAAWVFFIAALYYLLRRMRLAQRTQQRIDDESTASQQRAPLRSVAEMSWLRRWLYLAGFRRSGAPMLFVVATIVAAASGTILAVSVQLSGLASAVFLGVEAVPGGVGQIFLPLAMLFPWIAGILVAAVPWLVVRAARRQRVQLVQQDLPLMLELLATLSEAGIGFDAAVTRILNTRLAGRPIARELQTFQADLLAGRARVDALRRFSHRLSMSTVSIFVSALVQAEQVGMGIAGVLRRQADDMRSRRREQANAFAAALPVKRMLPLVVCFLPGLFVWTLGPFFVQLFKIADTFVQLRGL